MKPFPKFLENPSQLFKNSANIKTGRKSQAHFNSYGLNKNDSIKICMSGADQRNTILQS